jgi:hypothetical protein
MAIHPYNPGGDLTVALTNAQVIAGVPAIRGAQGRLCKVLVTTLIGANSIQFFDGLTATGTIIGIVPNASAVGAVFVFDMPYSIGLSTGAAAGGGAVTISLY